MTLWVLRIFFLILCVLGGWSIASLAPTWAETPRAPVFGSILGLWIGVAVIGLDHLLKGFSLRGFSAATFGLFLGSLIAFFIDRSGIFVFVPQEQRVAVQIGLFVIFSYLGMVMAIRGKDDFNLIIPYMKFMRQGNQERLTVLDTSGAIDGRIAELYEAGVLDGRLLIPRFVLRELQAVADSRNTLKRNRGRRGLEVLTRLQQNPTMNVRVHEMDFPEERDVDAKLVRMARMLGAQLLTTDYNLEKVAELQGVRVVNVNRIADAIRQVVLPGERLRVRLVREGKEADQGLAYLPDGTMVVVNRGKALLGREIDVSVSSTIQTSAGRMIFAEPSDNGSHGSGGGGDEPGNTARG